MAASGPTRDIPVVVEGFKEAAAAAVNYVRFGVADKPKQIPRDAGEVNWEKTVKYHSKFPKDKPRKENLFVGLGVGTRQGIAKEEEKDVDFLRIDFEAYDGQKEHWKALHFNVARLKKDGTVDESANHYSVCVQRFKPDETEKQYKDYEKKWKEAYDKEVAALQARNGKDIWQEWEAGRLLQDHYS